jgi:hypothetical protein
MYSCNVFKWLCLFRAIGFFDEADTLESSSILIYLFREQSMYTQKDGGKP